jgi:hypothetical protein
MLFVVLALLDDVPIMTIAYDNTELENVRCLALESLRAKNLCAE